MNHKIIITHLSLLGVLVFVAGCGKDKAQQVKSEPAAQPSILLAEAPASPLSVGQARQVAQPGEEISIVGQIGGTASPIVTAYASFVIADEDILFCTEILSDACTTPWDACCEDPEKIAANRASVVFLNADDKPMTIDLKRDAKLSELDKVTVIGVVAESSTPQNMIIEATGLYRHTP